MLSLSKTSAAPPVLFVWRSFVVAGVVGGVVVGEGEAFRLFVVAVEFVFEVVTKAGVEDEEVEVEEEDPMLLPLPPQLVLVQVHCDCIILPFLVVMVH